MNGVVGYRQMTCYLAERGYHYSKPTIHRYMNGILGLCSIVRRRKPQTKRGNADSSKVYPNLLQRNFTVDTPNRVWCIDFTYIKLANGSMRYNCSIIDLYDRSVVASITDRRITSELAERTVRAALKKHLRRLQPLILHSDQGRQFRSLSFHLFCQRHQIIQSMSRAGTPGDNAVMERYFNTLKHECCNLYSYRNLPELARSIKRFVRFYNTKRPHSYLLGKTPYAARKVL